MADMESNRGSVGSGTVTKTTISFANNIGPRNNSSSTGAGTGHVIKKQDVIDFDIELGEIEEPEKYANAVGAKQVSGFMSLLSGIVNFVDQALSTAAVLATSVTSGVLDLVEHAVDGVAWVASTVGQALGADTTGIKEFIARDLVDEANEWFYENTDLGRHINDASAIKYDSEFAQGVRSVTEKAAEIAAATALTVCSGGAATFLVGTVVGLGKAAEMTYQTNGTDTTLVQELGIAGSGVLTGLSWYATGKMGQGALNIGKDIAKCGAKEVFGSITKQVFSKDFWIEALRKGTFIRNHGHFNLNAVMNYASSALATGDTLVPFITGKEEFNATGALKVAGTFVFYLGVNVLEDTGRDYLSDYKAGRIVGEALDAAGAHAVDIDDANVRHVDGQLEATGEIPVVRDDLDITEEIPVVKDNLDITEEIPVVRDDLEITEKIPVITDDVDAGTVARTAGQIELSDGQKVVNEYLENIEEMQRRGISLPDFLESHGIKTVDMATELDAAKYLGDSKLFVIESLKNVWNDPNLPSSDRFELRQVLLYATKNSVGDVDAAELIRRGSKFLSEDEVKIANELLASGLVEGYALNATPEQLNAVFNYTACGGFEVNAWLNDTVIGTGGPMARSAYSSIDEIQDVVSGHQLPGGRSNRIFPTTDGSITDGLDGFIDGSKYDDAIVTYRGVRQLYDGHTPVDLSTLKVGSELTTPGYQSSSVVMSHCYGCRANDDQTNIILQILVPPRSGSAAYIENVTGVCGYGQMEMLVKRNATLVVVGDKVQQVINGTVKTIIPVVVK